MLLRHPRDIKYEVAANVLRECSELTMRREPVNASIGVVVMSPICPWRTNLTRTLWHVHRNEARRRRPSDGLGRVEEMEDGPSFLDVDGPSLMALRRSVRTELVLIMAVLSATLIVTAFYSPVG